LVVSPKFHASYRFITLFWFPWTWLWRILKSNSSKLMLLHIYYLVSPQHHLISISIVWTFHYYQQTVECCQQLKNRIIIIITIKDSNNIATWRNIINNQQSTINKKNIMHYCTGLLVLPLVLKLFYQYNTDSITKNYGNINKVNMSTKHELLSRQ
jgi:hypothetical protein